MQILEIVKFSEQSVGRRWKTTFLGEDLEDRLTPETKACLKLEGMACISLNLFI